MQLLYYTIVEMYSQYMLYYSVESVLLKVDFDYQLTLSLIYLSEEFVLIQRL